MSRWIARAGFAIAAFMVPWCLLLAYTLPSTTRVRHWSLAWVGLDALEGIFAGLTALCVLRRDRRAALSATVFGALLSIDAWFDVCTSGFDRIAVLEAMFVEIPLAVGAFTFAYLDNKRFERLLSQHVFRGTADHRPKAVRGLAHPLRWRILELVQQQGPLTATQVSDIVGESPANCSFHLRTLGKYGFIEEVGTGKGRTRPWRGVDFSMEVDEDELDGTNKEASLAVGLLLRQAAAHRIDQWTNNRDRFPVKWRKASFDFRCQIPLTASELDALREHIDTFIGKYRGRAEIPDDALQVSFTAAGFPVEDTQQRRRRLKRKASS